MVTDQEIEEALKGLLNNKIHTAHPKAHNVIVRLARENRKLRAKLENSTMKILNDLIDLDGPCREMDKRLAAEFLCMAGNVPRYTESLDAAIQFKNDILSHHEYHDHIIARTNGGSTIHAQLNNQDMVLGNNEAIAMCTAAIIAWKEDQDNKAE